jgi:U3 small nucleolar RNA-associated protein 21
MAVFLKIHGEEVARSAKLMEALKYWRQCQESEGVRVGELVGFCSGVVGFLRNPNKF